MKSRRISFSFPRLSLFFLSHRCAAVRESTAQHLHQLAEIIGEDHILTAGKIFAGSFLSAVCKMSMDAAPEVRWVTGFCMI